MIDIEKAEEDFDDFLFSIDDQMDALDHEEERHGIQLDVTMNSLEKLESLFFKLADNADEDTRGSLIVTFARYVGEIVSTSYGGKWEQNLWETAVLHTLISIISWRRLHLTSLTPTGSAPQA